jgi:predicted nucleotidyltransferase
MRVRDLSREAIIARVRDGILAARDDVMGIVIFGSFARGSAWHDVDVLAVLRDPISNRAAWREIAIQLTNSINLVELDLIPTWLEGLRLGLGAHRPLLMEVAFDGLVVHDRAGIADLLRAARLEIAQAGIRRTTTGWQLPVAYRQASPL